MKNKILKLSALTVLLLSFVPAAHSQNIAISGYTATGDLAQYLNNLGYNAIDYGGALPTATELLSADMFFLLRMPGNNDVKDYVLNGGCLITEWDSSEWALNTAGLLNATDTGGGYVNSASNIDFVSPDGDPISSGLAPSYSDNGATEFFRDLVVTGLGVTTMANFFNTNTSALLR